MTLYVWVVGCTTVVPYHTYTVCARCRATVQCGRADVGPHPGKYVRVGRFSEGRARASGMSSSQHWTGLD